MISQSISTCLLRDMSVICHYQLSPITLKMSASYTFSTNKGIMERHDRSRVVRERSGRKAMSAKRSVTERKMSTMTHPIISPGSDGANSSDGHNSSKLDAVQANNHGAKTTMPGGSTCERMYALPLSQGFALSNMSIAELAAQCITETHTKVRA